VVYFLPPFPPRPLTSSPIVFPVKAPSTAFFARPAHHPLDSTLLRPSLRLSGVLSRNNPPPTRSYQRGEKISDGLHPPDPFALLFHAGLHLLLIVQVACAAAKIFVPPRRAETQSYCPKKPESEPRELGTA